MLTALVVLGGCRPPLLASPCAGDGDCPEKYTCHPAWKLCVPARAVPPPARCGSMSAIRDDFERADAVRGLGLACPASVQQHVLVFTTQSGGSRNWPTCQSQFGASLRGDSLSLEIVAPPTRADSQVFFGIRDAPAAQELWVEIALIDGQLALLASADAGAVVGDAVLYDPQVHHLWRLREQDDVLYAETSPGGTGWQPLAHLVAPAFVARAIPYLGLSAAENQSDTLVVDNLNTDRPAAAWCPLAELHDDFAAPALDPAWKPYPASAASCTTGLLDGAAALTLRPGDHDSCELFRSEGRLIADSQVAVEVVQRPPAGFGVGLELWSARGDVVLWSLFGDTAVALVHSQAGLGGFGPDVTPAASARWLRLRMAGATLHFELRDDAQDAWRTAFSYPVPVDLRLDPHSLALLLEREGGSLTAEGITARLDKLNPP